MKSKHHGLKIFHGQSLNSCIPLCSNFFFDRPEDEWHDNSHPEPSGFLISDKRPEKLWRNSAIFPENVGVQSSVRAHAWN